MSGKRKKVAQNENEQAQTRQAQKKDEVPEKKEQIENLLYIYRHKQAGQSIHILRPVCFHIVDLIFLNRRLTIIPAKAGNRSFRIPAFARTTPGNFVPLYGTLTSS